MPKKQEDRKKAEKKAPVLGVEPLQSRNVILYNQRRTSMRLEPSMWSALEDIAKREKMSANELCTRIHARLVEQGRQKGLVLDESKKSSVTFTSGIRVFISAYFRAAATDKGHMDAGHGLGDPFSGTPFEKKNNDGGAAPEGGGPSDPPPSATDGQSGGQSGKTASSAAA